MKKISHRIGNLELKNEKGLGTNARDYLEIVEWMKDDENKKYCYTIATFEEGDGGFNLESVGERIILEGQKWIDLGILVRLGFEHIGNGIFEEKDEKEDN